MSEQSHQSSHSIDPVFGLPRMAVFGSLLGCTAWAVVLGLVSLVTGVIGDVWLHVVGAIAISLALGVATLAFARLIALARSDGGGTNAPPIALDAFWGMLLITLATLFLLGSHWIVPKVASIASVRGLLGPGVIVATPDAVSVALAAIGACLVAKAWISTMRTQKHAPNPAPATPADHAPASSAAEPNAS